MGDRSTFTLDPRPHSWTLDDKEFWAIHLFIYPCAEEAIAHSEGIEYVEGDLLFFSADGSPLAPDFSKKPYIDHERNAYFPGLYTLIPTSGENLETSLRKFIGENPTTRIFIETPSAKDKLGDRSNNPTQTELSESLRILPTDLLSRVAYFPGWGLASCSRYSSGLSKWRTFCPQLVVVLLILSAAIAFVSFKGVNFSSDFINSVIRPWLPTLLICAGVAAVAFSLAARRPLKPMRCISKEEALKTPGNLKLHESGNGPLPGN